jgi:hypothetical protein
MTPNKISASPRVSAANAMAAPKTAADLASRRSQNR